MSRLHQSIQASYREAFLGPERIDHRRDECGRQLYWAAYGTNLPAMQAAHDARRVSQPREIGVALHAFYEGHQECSPSPRDKAHEDATNTYSFIPVFTTTSLLDDAVHQDTRACSVARVNRNDYPFRSWNYADSHSFRDLAPRDCAAHVRLVPGIVSHVPILIEEPSTGGARDEEVLDRSFNGGYFRLLVGDAGLRVSKGGDQ